MNFRKKIVLMFVANHLESFNDFIKKNGVATSPLFTGYLINHAASISGFLGTKIDDIVDFDTVYKNAERNHPIVERTPEEAIKLCDNDIVVALDNECELSFKNDDVLIQTVCEIRDRKQIKALLYAIRYYGDDFHLLKMIFDSYKHYGCYLDDDTIDYLMASFVKENESLIDSWLKALNAINFNEKKNVIEGWVNEVIVSKRIMKELFYSENDDLKAVA